MNRIGFTASRDGMTGAQRRAFEDWAAPRLVSEFHHGDCVGGDEQAHNIARLFQWRIVIHPGPSGYLRANCAGYDVLCPVKPNLDRNSDIVAEADEMAAAPKGPEELRSGTWSTIRKARRSGKPLTIFWPDGSVTFENQGVGDLV